MHTENKLIPNAFIIGAPKSGTSSLFYWLAQHPDVCPSKIKEPYYLMDKQYRDFDSYQISGLDGYKKLFSNYSGEKILLEATPSYMHDETPLEVISKLSPLPQVFVILRKPSSTIYSRYKAHKFRVGSIAENVSFKDFVENKGMLHSQDPIGELERTKYVNYLKKWRAQIPESNFHIFIFENEMKNPLSFVIKVSEILGIDKDWWTEEKLVHRNESIKTKSKALHKLGVKLTPFIPHQIQNLLLPIYMKLNAGKVPSMSDEDRQTITELDKYYEKYNNELEELTGIDLSVWKA